MAASLQVTPVGLQVTAPGGATSMQLTNEGALPLSAQLRVFRWRQQDGAEILEPTDAVVASPPAVTLAPRAQYTVRVIRLDATPITTEESFRVIVDELPNEERMQNGAINMVLRYSIPLFFTAPSAAAPRINWSVAKQNGRLAVLATNDGDRHLRISAMKVRDHAGPVVSFGDGLAGYVLGQSTMRFLSKNKTSGFSSGSATVKADSDLGRVDAAAAIRK